MGGFSFEFEAIRTEPRCSAQANEALHNRRKMVAETNRAKHLVKLCEAGMHADALREQLHDSAQDFTDFNHVKDAVLSQCMLKLVQHDSSRRWRLRVPSCLPRHRRDAVDVAA